MADSPEGWPACTMTVVSPPKGFITNYSFSTAAKERGRQREKKNTSRVQSGENTREKNKNKHVTKQTQYHYKTYLCGELAEAGLVRLLVHEEEQVRVSVVSRLRLGGGGGGVKWESASTSASARWKRSYRVRWLLLWLAKTGLRKALFSVLLIVPLVLVL